MTTCDMICGSKTLNQIKSEVGKPEVLYYQLAGNFLRPANFKEPPLVPNVIGMIVSCSETECMCSRHQNVCARDMRQYTVNSELDIMSFEDKCQRKL